MEKGSLGTHRGLFEAGLEMKKIVLSALEGTFYGLKSFSSAGANV